jgi:hypothetical protein
MGEIRGTRTGGKTLIPLVGLTALFVELRSRGFANRTDLLQLDDPDWLLDDGFEAAALTFLEAHRDERRRYRNNAADAD